MKRLPAFDWEICILAGGLSRRMGRDKSRLKLGSRTMLRLICDEAARLGWPVRVIRRDTVPRCGPLGGVFTALKTTRARAVVFLACDMPWISAPLLRGMQRRLPGDGLAVFVRSDEGAGFPFVLRPGACAMVARQIACKQFSLHALARALKARLFRPPSRWHGQLCNLNTPAEWERARRKHSRSQRRNPASPLTPRQRAHPAGSPGLLG